MSDELYALLTAHRHDNLQLFKDWSREKMRRARLEFDICYAQEKETHE